MKKTFNAFAFAATLMVAFSCAKETPAPDTDSDVNNPVITAPKTIEFSTSPITKTVFGTQDGTTLPTLWTTNYNVAVSLNLGSYKKSSELEVADGGATAKFTVDIADDDSHDYNIYAISPYEAVVGVNKTNNAIQFTIPTTQTSSDTSPDELAQVLYGEYAAGSTFPSSVTMDFEHLTAYGRISFSNLSLDAGESVTSVSLTAAENWAGRYYYYAEDTPPTYTAGEIIESSASNTITIATTGTSNIWFGCAPVDLGGKSVKVVITTDQSTTYTKNITIPAGKTFESGKVNAFTINMNGISADTADEYELVTDASELTVGSKVIIAAQGDPLFALSTTQNTNNRAATAVTKKNSDTVISGPSDAVQILTIADGNKSGTIAFSTGDGYLCAASSSSNWLRTEATLSDNSSWAVSITSGTGVASIVAQGNYTRNVMRYNTSSSIFACYSSASQSAVAIYKLPGTGKPKVTIADDIAAEVDEDDIIVTWTNPSDANVDHYVVTCTGQASQNVDPAEGGYTFEDLAEGNYTITVTAIAADPSTYQNSNTWESSSLRVGTPTTSQTFSYTDFEGQGISGGGSGSSINATKSVITVASNNGYGASEHVRIYQNAGITITSTGGNIVKVEVTCTASGTSNYGPGKLSAQLSSTYTYSGTVGTWEGTAAKSVTLNATAQCRFTQIVVTYEVE